jgi:adenosylhomocysteine nucleosidase
VKLEKPSLIVSFGVAGAIQAGVRVADVVIAGSAALLDSGVPDDILPCASLSAAAVKAVTDAVRGRGARLFFGTTISTSGPQAAPSQTAGISNPVMEMETHGIARVAARNGIPLLAIRAVSDSVEEPLPFSLEDFTDSDCTLRLAAFVAHAIRHPRILPLLMRLSRNTRAAAENAAVAVLAALSVPGPGPE